jgi:hypothetical protein
LRDYAQSEYNKLNNKISKEEADKKSYENAEKVGNIQT